MTDMSPELKQALADIVQERWRQDTKFPTQVDLIDNGLIGGNGDEVCCFHGIPTEAEAKAAYEDAAEVGLESWADVLIEEVAEAIAATAEDSTDNLRTELVQVAAVCVKWIQAIDRRVR